jgi:hypothetical protein
MTAASFENVPVTIRERIYDELLTFSTTQSTDKGRAPSSILCSLLFLNRQIHAEVIGFTKAQLPVLIKTNDPEFVEKIVGERKGPKPNYSFISQSRSANGSILKRIAGSLISMEIEMYMCHNHLDGESFAAFLLPASSMKEFLGRLSSPLWCMWTMQASVSFKLINTFSHTHEAALSKLVQPWIDWFLPQHFFGVTTEPALPQELSSQLRKRLLGDYAASGHLQKIQSLAHGGSERVQATDWRGAAERFCMAERYTKLVWDCHLECMKRDSDTETGRDLMRHLWLISANVMANHVQCLINAAVDLGAPVHRLEVRIGSGDRARLQEARAVAGMAVCFLRVLPTRYSDDVEAEEYIGVRKAKAKLSFRAHLACTGLGDVEAAVEYLQDAKRHEPESATMLDAKIDALQEENDEPPGCEGGKAAVLWESQCLHGGYNSWTGSEGNRHPALVSFGL